MRWYNCPSHQMLPVSFYMYWLFFNKLFQRKPEKYDVMCWSRAGPSGLCRARKAKLFIETEKSDFVTFIPFCPEFNLLSVQSMTPYFWSSWKCSRHGLSDFFEPRLEFAKGSRPRNKWESCCRRIEVKNFNPLKILTFKKFWIFLTLKKFLTLKNLLTLKIKSFKFKNV